MVFAIMVIVGGHRRAEANPAARKRGARMYRVALCDDNYDYLKFVEAQIQKYCLQKNIRIELKVFQDGSRLEEATEQGNLFDAYILDIEMPVCSGMDIARQIGNHSPAACVIFLTAHGDYAIEACSLNVIRYVLKDRMEQELDVTLNDLFFRLERLSSHKAYIISNNRKYVKLLHKDIIYIYKRQKNVVFVLPGKREEQERTTLQNVYEKLENPDLVWLDRGIILNLIHVQRVSNDVVEMKDGHKILTGAEHALELKRRLNTYWGDLI